MIFKILGENENKKTQQSKSGGCSKGEVYINTSLLQEKKKNANSLTLHTKELGKKQTKLSY